MQNTPNAQSLRIILFVVWATSDPAGNLREVEWKGSAVAWPHWYEHMNKSWLQHTIL